MRGLRGFSDWLHQLKRRNVLRAAALYLGGIWALAQGIAQLAPVFGFHDWVTRWFVIAGVIGFPFWIAFAWFYEFTPEGLKRESELDPHDPAARSHDRRLDRWIIGVLLVAVVLLVTNQFVLRRDATSVADEAAAQGVAPAAGARSIAVLPLVNASGDAAQQFFSDGLSESLIDALSNFSGLRVIGRSSSFQFRDSKEDARSIGAKLGVAYLLNGSVQHAGDAVRIRAEVVNTRDGTTLWTHQYDRPYRDLFALQDELAQSIAGVLKGRLLPGNSTPSGDRPKSGNLAAYDQYLKGIHDATIGTEESFARSVAEFREATRLDPGYALAWAKLARSLVARATLGISTDAARDFADAQAAVDTALRLDPKLAEAHMSRAYWLENARLDWQGALASYDRALELAPGNDWVRFNAYGMRGLMGQLDEPIRQIHAVLQDNPLEASWWIWYSGYLTADGRLQDAEQAARRALDLQPSASGYWMQVVVIDILRNDPKAALVAAHHEPEDVWRDAAVALALQIGPDRTAADAALQTLIDKHGDSAPYQIAQAQALRRDPDAMFVWLEKARTSKDGALENLLIDPIILRYRHDPRLAAFCAKIGLPSPLLSQTRGI